MHPHLPHDDVETENVRRQKVLPVEYTSGAIQKSDPTFCQTDQDPAIKCTKYTGSTNNCRVHGFD